MMPDSVKVEFTPPDLIQRLQRYPQQVDKVAKVAMAASVLTVQEHVPPYPSTLPNQRYQRTGQLGRSLGSGQSGGVMGTASISRVKRFGAGAYEGQFGTNLRYAPDVIGDGTQKEIHRGRWWTLNQVLKRATPKILRLWEKTSEQLARFIEGKG